MADSRLWKYSTLALLAILALGLAIPQASAHITNNTQHMLQHIYNFVDGIEAKTNNLPEDPADNSEIKNAIDEAVAEIGARKVVFFDYTVDPADGEQIDKVVLPIDGNFYHVTAYVYHLSGVNNVVQFACEFPAITDFEPIDSGEEMRGDFVCDRVQLYNTDISNGVDNAPISVYGWVEYFEISEDNVSELD